jgi:hypothetical protein
MVRELVEYVFNKKLHTAAFLIYSFWWTFVWNDPTSRVSKNLLK